MHNICKLCNVFGTISWLHETDCLQSYLRRVVKHQQTVHISVFQAYSFNHPQKPVPYVPSITPTLYNLSAAQQSGLSLRGRGQGFPLATKDVAISYVLS